MCTWGWNNKNILTINKNIPMLVIEKTSIAKKNKNLKNPSICLLFNY